MRSLLLLAALLAGCHWLVSHDPGAPPDQARDLALPPRPDLQRERAVPADAPPRDARRDASVVAVDLKQKPEAKLAQDLKPDTLCSSVEGDPISKPYTCPVANCPSGDCDGLPAARDPDAACNPLRFAEPFSSPAWTSWGRSYCDDDHEEVLCGRMRFKLPSSQTQAIWRKQTVDTTDLVELRFLAPTAPFTLELIVSDKMLEPGDCYGWQVPILWGCKLEGATGQVGVSVGGNGNWSGTTSVQASGWLVLQLRLWATGRSCRLFAGTSLVADATEGAPTAPSSGALVMVEAVNPPGPPLTLDLDWVRVFVAP
jgi:hypothetical protein